MAYRVTLIPGDGTGPELVAATAPRAGGHGRPVRLGGAGGWRRRHGKVRHAPARHVLDSIRANKVALKGPITTPVGSGLPQRERGHAQGP